MQCSYSEFCKSLDQTRLLASLSKKDRLNSSVHVNLQKGFVLTKLEPASKPKETKLTKESFMRQTTRRCQTPNSVQLEKQLQINDVRSQNLTVQNQKQLMKVESPYTPKTKNQQVYTMKMMMNEAAAHERIIGRLVRSRSGSRGMQYEADQ
ncbi:Hypothetical_protein [Hexamita inflata]|uniref:Hypothetical_protein n=1 Tax=Hexamita inflata TaxID=28002 RepID=A0ABP1HZD0_9EUKA